MRKLLGLFLVPWLAANALAWDATGHMVASAIAYQNLTPHAKAEVDRLLQIGGDPKTQDFLGASAWADDIRRERPETAAWHFVNYHFRSDGQPTNNRPGPQNVESAVTSFSSVLADRSQTDENRAEALRFLMHFVEDAHQPLHCVDRDSDEHPHGDRGGNEFPIISPPGAKPAAHNLHALWDEGGGLFPYIRRPLTSNSIRKIYTLADQLMAAYGAAVLRPSNNLEVQDWTRESVHIAETQAYNLQEGTMPDPSYVAMVQTVSGKRIVVAGLRLAHLLNKLLA